MALKIAQHIKLNGIMDIESVENKDNIFILEIDARFPSQTPICVYHSSGINLVSELIKKNQLCNIKEEYKNEKYCIFEHFEITKNKEIIFGGEHLISKSKMFDKYYTDTKNGIEIFRAININKNFVYTLICYGLNENEVIIKSKLIIEKIKLYS